MSSILHKLILSKEGRPSGGLPTQTTGRLHVTELPTLLRFVLSMAIRGRSFQLSSSTFFAAMTWAALSTQPTVSRRE